MKISMIAIIAVFLIIAVLVFKEKKPTEVITPTTTTIPTQAPVAVTGEESILSDQINSLTEEQLKTISIDITNFSTTTQNDIATDSSLFMYQ